MLRPLACWAALGAALLSSLPARADSVRCLPFNPFDPSTFCSIQQLEAAVPPPSGGDVATNGYVNLISLSSTDFINPTLPNNITDNGGNDGLGSFFNIVYLGSHSGGLNFGSIVIHTVTLNFGDGGPEGGFGDGNADRYLPEPVSPALLAGAVLVLMALRRRRRH